MDAPHVEETADVDPRAVLGPGTTIWHLAQIREHARLGSGCIVGRGAYVGPGVLIGDNVKLQNYALVYDRPGWRTAYSSAPQPYSPTTCILARST